MRTMISFFMLILTKLFSQTFYTLQLRWLSEQQDFDKVRLIVLLNHTSLYEPLLIQAAPNWFIWRLARNIIVPIANKTLDRPIVGKFWKILIPGLVSISRKRDRTWFKFLRAIENRSVIVIAAEGRMKRHQGLDAYGKPMSVKSGIADILTELNEGNMLIAYSGGLHHIQYPGELFPRLFKTIKLNLEIVDIAEYKSQFSGREIEIKKQIVADFNKRLQLRCS